ncbi:hypothetical protein [Aquisalinus flavus]|uniref:Uncharacterized protein n=1 Tax=Aquisalinus flavus TaxID=1526572 RepID=A0A8J2V7L2_9PROT|nr:hypothetical protein [Aquisalinus flavus]MBD0426120.1 hypothetical protein [Aquisalinus flavus]UNE48295.1 hypothetical protein FF099_09675 [Aquisalinus flavus]GGD10497.1 hypothetical protein GCM10011342_19190 [Aquisalinus flavus]
MKSALSRLVALGAGLAVATVSTVASAQSPLKELRARQAEERQLASEVAYTGNVCSARISSRIDWNRARDWPADESLADACDNALGAIEAICRGGGSDKVANGISSFTCTGDGSGPSLDGKTLTFGARPGGNGFSQTRSYLEDSL